MAENIKKISLDEFSEFCNEISKFHDYLNKYRDRIEFTPILVPFGITNQIDNLICNLKHINTSMSYAKECLDNIIKQINEDLPS